MPKFLYFLSGSKSRAYKSNVLVSISWVFAFCEILFGVGVMKGPELWIKIFSAIIMTILLIFYCFMYGYFAIKDPDRLQSEGYNLERQNLDTLYEQKDDHTISVPKNNTINIQTPDI
jgi:hypothetical protein